MSVYCRSIVSMALFDQVHSNVPIRIRFAGTALLVPRCESDLTQIPSSTADMTVCAQCTTLSLITWDNMHDLRRGEYEFLGVKIKELSFSSRRMSLTIRDNFVRRAWV